MDFHIANRPPGPRYTIIHFHSSQETLDYRDLASTEGKLWAACFADIAKATAWSFTLYGRLQEGEERRKKAMLVIGWKGDKELIGPSWWTSTPAASTSPPPQSPFTPLLPLLDSTPRILHVAFRPPLPPHATVRPIDMITLYIPVRVDDAELAAFGRQIHSFQTSFAHVSHEPAREMVWASRGWGMEEVVHREKGVKMMVHVLLHAWKSKDDESRYKSKDADEYERLLLKPLREAERLGVEWNEEQVLLEDLEPIGEDGGLLAYKTWLWDTLTP